MDISEADETLGDAVDDFLRRQLFDFDYTESRKISIHVCSAGDVESPLVIPQSK